MNIRKGSIVLLILCVGWACQFCFAKQHPNKTETYGDITVSVVSVQDDRHHGYAENIINIKNHSLDRIYRVTLSSANEDLTKTVAVPANQEIEVPFLQTPTNSGAYCLKVEINGRIQEKGIEVDFSNLHSSYDRYSSKKDIAINILLGKDVSYDTFSKAFKKAEEVKKSKYDSSCSSDNERDIDFQTIESKNYTWSTNWLAYTAYDGIVITAEEMNSLPANAADAIMKYVRCGGSLLILGKANIKPIYIKNIEVSDPLLFCYIDFGVCVLNELKNPWSWSKDTWDMLDSRAWKQTAPELMRYREIAAENDEFKIVESLAVPIRGLFSFVLVFAIIIGPVNLFVLHKMNKRIWMLWTVPVISIVTSIAVFAYCLLSEGLDSNSRIRSITILNQNTATATTLGIEAFYCPLTPRGGLKFENETEVTPIGIDPYGYRSNRNRTVDWTECQNWNRGWVIGRVPAHFLMRKNQTCSQSISITDSNQGPVAKNFFENTISILWYADKDGKIYSTKNIAPLAKAALGQTKFVCDSSKAVWRETLAGSWASIYDRIIERPQNYLTPGTYLAVVNDFSFIEQPLKNIKNQKIETLVFGTLDGF
jgi:hypothetical protein